MTTGSVDDLRRSLEPQLSQLLELQRVDLRILEIQEQLYKLPARLQKAERSIADETKKAEAVTNAHDKLVKERRDRERELETQEAHIQKLRCRQTDLKTNKEYQAFLFELDLANKKKGELEERVLAIFDQLEQKQVEMQQAQATLAAAKQAYEQEAAEIKRLEESLQSEAGVLQEKRQAMVAEVDPALYQRYATLKATRKDLVIVPIRNHTCFGCRLQLRPQLIAEVKRSPESLHVCTYCQRILYMEQTEEQPARTSSETHGAVSESLQ